MKRNPVFFYITLLLMLTSTIVGAMALEEEKVYFNDVGYTLGSKDFDVKISEMSFFDRVLYSLRNIQAMTVISGATCSINPDKEVRDWQPDVGQTQFCYANVVHEGVALQMFISETDGVPTWNYQGEQQIAKGEEKCFNVRTENKYTWTLYYCDSLSERTCSDTDGGKDYDDKGTVTFTLDGNSNSETDFCYETNKLSEIYCDSDNSMASISKTCDYKCLDGECVDEPADEVTTTTTTTTATTSAIPIDILEVITDKAEYKVGERVIIVGSAYINEDVEAGIIETSLFLPLYTTFNPLSIVETESERDIGVCVDDMTTGVKFKANKGDTVVFTLNLVAGIEGTYTTKIVSATACGEDYVDSKSINFKIVETDESVVYTDVDTIYEDVEEYKADTIAYVNEENNVDFEDEPVTPIEDNEKVNLLDYLGGDETGLNDIEKNNDVITQERQKTNYSALAFIGAILLIGAAGVYRWRKRK